MLEAYRSRHLRSLPRSVPVKTDSTFSYASLCILPTGVCWTSRASKKAGKSHQNFCTSSITDMSQSQLCKEKDITTCHTQDRGVS